MMMTQKSDPQVIEDDFRSSRRLFVMGIDQQAGDPTGATARADGRENSIARAENKSHRVSPGSGETSQILWCLWSSPIGQLYTTAGNRMITLSRRSALYLISYESAPSSKG